MGFLSVRIPKGSLGATAVKRITQKWETLDASREELARHGFGMTAAPGGDVPHVDARLLEDISNPNYLVAYSQLTAWYSFGESLKSEYLSEINECKTALNILAAEIRKAAKEDHDRYKGEKGWKVLSSEDYKTLLLTNEEYQTVLLRCQQAEQKLELLTGRMKGMFRTISLMSRNIEMKKMEMGAQSGVNNWNGRTRSPSPRPSFGGTPVLHPHQADDGPEEDE